MLRASALSISSHARLLLPSASGVPVPPESADPTRPQRHRLADFLDALLRRLALIGNKNGAPLTRAGLSQLMREAIEQAGLPGKCKSHGLRKAAMRRQEVL
jgi:hypothetical protein